MSVQEILHSGYKFVFKYLIDRMVFTRAFYLVKNFTPKSCYIKVKFYGHKFIRDSGESTLH